MDKPNNRGKATDIYASLHRVAENGEATDATWQRLAGVCIELGKQDEAVDAFYKISDPAFRRGLRRQLAQRGWVPDTPDEDEVRSLMVTDADLNPTTREKFDDSLRFLFEGNMPAYTLVGTLAFPIVLGLGGLLTGSSDSLLLRLVALLPALLVLGAVGVFGRQVLLIALEERDDASGLPTAADVLRDLPRIVVDITALSAVFLMPGVVLILLGLPLFSAPLFLVSALLLPMSAALRLVTNDWRALQPGPLLGAVRRTGSAYLSVALVITLLFTPAALAFFLTVKMPVFLMISVTGPLIVAPLFVAARMMGLTLHYEQRSLEDLFPWATHTPQPQARPQPLMRRLAVPSSTKNSNDESSVTAAVGAPAEHEGDDEER